MLSEVSMMGLNYYDTGSSPAGLLAWFLLEAAENASEVEARAGDALFLSGSVTSEIRE